MAQLLERQMDALRCDSPLLGRPSAGILCVDLSFVLILRLLKSSLCGARMCVGCLAGYEME